MSTFLLQLTALLLSRPSLPRPQFRSFSLPFRTQSEAKLVASLANHGGNIQAPALTKSIGIDVPPMPLTRADEVIE
jgi:hypothetical protein